MSRRFANVAGILAAVITAVFLLVEVEASVGGPHVSELARVGMHILAVMLGSAYFMRRTMDCVITEYQEAHPPVDEMHIARAAAAVVVSELAPQIKAAVDAAYRSGLVAGAERATRSNGHSSGGFPKLAHLPSRES